MKVSGIYIIENVQTGGYYYGSAKNLSKRWADHKTTLRNNKGTNRHLQHAWNKYGEGAFQCRLVEEVQDVDKLFEIEDKYLAEHVGKPKCYNVKKSAGDIRPSGWNGKYWLGKKRPDVARKASLRQKGKPRWPNGRSEEDKRKMSLAKVGHAVSELTKQKIRNTMMAHRDLHSRAGREGALKQWAEIRAGLRKQPERKHRSVTESTLKSWSENGIRNARVTRYWEHRQNWKGYKHECKVDEVSEEDAAGVTDQGGACAAARVSGAGVPEGTWAGDCAAHHSA